MFSLKLSAHIQAYPNWNLPLVTCHSPLFSRRRVSFRLRFFQRRLRRGEAGDRNPIRRATDVVEPRVLADFDRARVAAMLAANPHLQFFMRLLKTCPRRPPFRGCELQQPPHTLRVELSERIGGPDLLLDVARDDLTAIVARKPEGGLRQIVCAKAEKLGF